MASCLDCKHLDLTKPMQPRCPHRGLFCEDTEDGRGEVLLAEPGKRWYRAANMCPAYGEEEAP